ncbi:MAG: entericidin A/B family lipoprotein [Ramlibacter sp.]
MKNIALLLALGYALAACSTMEGFGKDVKKVGSKIESSADKHK